MAIFKYFISAKVILFIIIFLPLLVFPQIVTTQDNPLLILHTSAPPKIDGIGNDLCWQNAKWQTIGEVWVPYNASYSTSSYSGRYKVLWSSSTNLLYFLIEVTDDVIVDGYTAKNGTCYNYDISEVFIDENHSGGEHRYDGATTNAENAFAYHMYCDYPADGQGITTPYIEDMVGTQANSKWIERTSHFPEFVLRKNGNTFTREFSLIVYNDTYTDANKEAARVKLQAEKIMGLSVAYCDNDHPNKNPKVRDNMFGSVKEPSPGNMHWMNADYFGTVKLVSENSTGVEKNNSNELPSEFKLNQNFPNPFNPETVISYQIPAFSHVTLTLFDLLGREVTTLVNEFKQAGSYNYQFSILNLPAGRQGSQLPSGIYFYRIHANSFTETKKLLLMK